MDTQLPAGLAGWDQVIRDRQERLHAEAREERLARAARAGGFSSRKLTTALSFAVRRSPAGVGTIGGNEQ